MMKIDLLAAGLHRLGDRSVTELIKYGIIVAGSSADHEVEVCMLDNNPTGLEKAEIERVVGNQHNRLFQATSGLKGSIGIERHHHGGSRREEEETAQPIRG